MSQIALFSADPSLAIPPAITTALENGAALALSLSGGKDSQAMLEVLVPWFRQRQYPGDLVIVHSDLGKAEWSQTPGFVAQLAAHYNLPLLIARRPAGDLVDRIEERMLKLAGSGKPFWPSSSNRYCTSDLKRGPINVVLRKLGNLVVSAEGVRASESPDRAAKPVCEIRTSITASSKKKEKDVQSMPPEQALAARLPKQRVALDWRPLHLFSTEQVWQTLGTSSLDLGQRRSLYRRGQHTAALDGWQSHPAYVFGNARLSCSMCVLATKNDLTNGANHHPAIYAKYLEMEQQSGKTFKSDLSLLSLPVTGEAARIKQHYLNQPT